MNIQQKLAENRWGGKIDFEIVSREPDQVVAKMPVTEEAKNPFGTMHAGALIWFADVTATLCAVRDLATVSESGAGFPLAIDLHTVLTGNEREGVLTAISKAVKRGSQGSGCDRPAIEGPNKRDPRGCLSDLRPESTGTHKDSSKRYHLPGARERASRAKFPPSSQPFFPSGKKGLSRVRWFESDAIY